MSLRNSAPLADGDRAELERLRAERIAIQNNSRALTCVWCGHVYPPDTPKSNHELLFEHVFECTEHPAAKVVKVVTQFLEDEYCYDAAETKAPEDIAVNEMLDRLKAAIEGLTFSVGAPRELK